MNNSYFNAILKTVLVILLIPVMTSPTFAEVKAYLNQSSFYEGDPITLKIESTESNKSVPDLSPLEKDFIILGTSTNTQINIFNGSRSSMKSWVIELQPNNKGSLQIPAIAIGKVKTKPISLTITDLPPEVTAETTKHIFIEERVGTVSNTTFVQQQIPYTVKLFYDNTLQTAQIYSPTIENAIIEKLGADKRYRVTRGGKKFTVVEKHYVISPEKSGALHIPASVAKGRIALSGGDSPKLRQRMDETDMLNKFFNGFGNDSFFQDFGGGFLSRRSRGPSKPFTISGKTFDVEVLPVPKEFTGSAWLPAEDLIIKDSWATNPPELKVGEPVTRTLTLQAKGLAGSQIPDITFTKPNKVKSYPEKAISDTRTDGNTVYGIQKIEISYIPDSKGNITIPEVKVDWWDVIKKEQSTTTLPEWNLNVAADLSIPTEENPKVVEPQIAMHDAPETHNLSPELSNETEEKKAWIEYKIMAFALLIALLTFLLYRFRMRASNGQSRTFNKPLKTKNTEALRASLLQACRSNNKQQSANELLKYTRSLWNDRSIQNLGILTSQLSSGAVVIKSLEQSLYGVNVQSWNGEELANLVESGLQQKIITSTNNDDGLTPLYPA